MNVRIVLLVATAIAPMFAASVSAQTPHESGYESPREDETAAQRAQRLANDRAHSTAHANETPAQRAQRLANDRAHSTAHANETPAQRTKRLADDRTRSMTAERNETPTAADAAADQQRLAADKARALAKKHPR